MNLVFAEYSEKQKLHSGHQYHWLSLFIDEILLQMRNLSLIKLLVLYMQIE